MHGCMVYTERAPRRQQFHMARAMQRPNSAVGTPLRWIVKRRAIKTKTKQQNHNQNSRSECIVRCFLERREYIYCVLFSAIYIYIYSSKRTRTRWTEPKWHHGPVGRNGISTIKQKPCSFDPGVPGKCSARKADSWHGDYTRPRKLQWPDGSKPAQTRNQSIS